MLEDFVSGETDAVEGHPEATRPGYKNGVVIYHRKAGTCLLAIPAPFDVLRLHRGRAGITAFVSHRSL